MSNFVRWKMGCWCAEAAHTFKQPWLIDSRILLRTRFDAACKLLHPDQ